MHAPGPTSSRLTASERREQLLEVTTRIVAERGFQGVSIESVAREAGISRPIVYEHFGHLQGLLEAVVEREMSRAFSQVSETALTDLTEGDHRELMLESLRAFLYAVRDHPSTWRLVLMPAEGAPELLRKGLARGRTVVLAQLAQAVRPIMRASESPDAELTARVLSAISDEYARLILTDPDRFTPERLVDHARWLLDKWAL